MGLRDPPKPGVREAIKEMNVAGVQVGIGTLVPVVVVVVLRIPRLTSLVSHESQGMKIVKKVGCERGCERGTSRPKFRFPLYGY